MLHHVWRQARESSRWLFPVLHVDSLFHEPNLSIFSDNDLFTTAILLFFDQPY